MFLACQCRGINRPSIAVSNRKPCTSFHIDLVETFPQFTALCYLCNIRRSVISHKYSVEPQNANVSYIANVRARRTNIRKLNMQFQALGQNSNLTLPSSTFKGSIPAALQSCSRLDCINTLVVHYTCRRPMECPKLDWSDTISFKVSKETILG